MKSHNGVLQPAAADKRRRVEEAPPPAVIVRREDERRKPQVREQPVEGQHVSAVRLERWQHHGEEV